MKEKITTDKFNYAVLYAAIIHPLNRMKTNHI